MKNRVVIPRAFAVLAIFAALFIIDATDCEAQTAPAFSHGPSIPFVVVSFDSTGNDAEASLLAAGAGYSLNWNLLPSGDGRVRMLTVGVPLFVQFPDGGDFVYRAGLTFGTFNNLFSTGAVVTLVDTEQDRGAFLGRLRASDVSVVFSFGFNFGSGSQAPSGGLSKVAGAPAKAPPCYVSF